jgi:hypothetical protein
MTVEDLVEVVLVDADETAAGSTPDAPAAALVQRDDHAHAAAMAGAAIVRLDGFNIQEQPLVTGIASRPGEVVAAKTTVPLTTALIGRSVVALFENADAGKPIIIGVVQGAGEPVERIAVMPLSPPHEGRLVLAADRELVLRCGDATITLTRAGKVIIKGRYIVSRSSGNNRIKGATVDIN